MKGIYCYYFLSLKKKVLSQSDFHVSHFPTSTSSIRFLTCRIFKCQFINAESETTQIKQKIKRMIQFPRFKII